MQRMREHSSPLEQIHAARCFYFGRLFTLSAHSVNARTVLKRKLNIMTRHEASAKVEFPAKKGISFRLHSFLLLLFIYEIIIIYFHLVQCVCRCRFVMYRVNAIAAIVTIALFAASWADTVRFVRRKMKIEKIPKHTSWYSERPGGRRTLFESLFSTVMLSGAISYPLRPSPLWQHRTIYVDDILVETSMALQVL